MSGGGINELTQESLGANFVGASTIITIPAIGSITSTQLAPGRYRIVSDTLDIFVRQGASGVTATVNDAYIPLKTNDYFYVSDIVTQGYIAAYAANATKVTLTPQ